MVYPRPMIPMGAVLVALWIGVGIVGCSNDHHPILDPDSDTRVDTSFDSSPTDANLEEVQSSDTTEDAFDSGNSEQPVWTSGCECTEPEEKCTIGNYCGLPDAECGPEVGFDCPDGYTCQRQFSTSDIFVCVCKGEEHNCTPKCESNDDCPENLQVCSFEDGVCRWNVAGGCFSNIQCPDGYYCSSDEQCEPTGEGEVGDSCEEDSQCRTGICHDGYCDAQCLIDDDCDEGQGCQRSGGGWRGNGCVSVDCHVSCPSDERCLGDECLPPACITTDDCDTGDCILISEPEIVTSVGECVEPGDSTVERYCKPDEILSPAGYCQLTDPCWDDSHCDDPYQCDSGLCQRPIDTEAQP